MACGSAANVAEQSESAAAVGWPLLAHAGSTRSTLVRPAAPDFMDTAALGQRKRVATKAMSSSLALPSAGGDFNRASQVPSGNCSSDTDRAFGFTLTLRVTAGMSLQRPNGLRLSGERSAAERVRCSRGLGGFAFTGAPKALARRPGSRTASGADDMRT